MPAHGGAYLATFDMIHIEDPYSSGASTPDFSDQATTLATIDSVRQNCRARICPCIIYR